MYRRVVTVALLLCACGEPALQTATGPAQAASLPPGSVTIPVHVHVLRRNNGIDDVSDARIAQQINVLNQSFAGLTGGVGTNTPFRFALVSVDRTNNTLWNTSGASLEDRIEIGTVLRDGGPDALNLYLNNLGGGLLGVASTPEEYESEPLADGVFVLNGSLPGGFAAPYNEGDTAVTFVGRWLGLLPTWLGGCNTINDRVSDTPAGLPAYGCVSPGLVDTCTGVRFPGKDPVQNFMNETDDACKYEFTSGQRDRMDAMYQFYRMP